MTVTHVAALGSSFAAGPGIPPVADKAARRSSRNYPHLLAQRLGAVLTDLTVSGATTANVLGKPQLMPGRRFPPQLSALPADADLVTITVGGNDLRYGANLLLHGYAGRLAANPFLRPVAELVDRLPVPSPSEAEVDAVAANLARIAEAVRGKAKNARVLLVDYLRVLGPDTRTSREAPFDDATLDALRRLGDQVSNVFANAAHRSGAELIPIGDLSREHALGSAEPWVTGLARGPRPRPYPFHPNADGMAAVAGIIAAHVGT